MAVDDSKTEKYATSITDSPTNQVGDVESGESAKLHQSLKGRHMQMIAIGGSIGAGLFVGSGGALSKGGPGSLVIDFIIIGFMLLLTVNAMGELAAIYPVAGAFYNYSIRFIDPAWGFAMGWNYAMNWLIVLPFELTVAGVTIAFWTDPDGTGTPSINVAVWITIFLVLVVVINFFGVKGYGEVEFVLGLMKVLAVAGFIILGVIIDVGGVPTDTRGYIGAKYWHDPGAFRNGFKGFCSVFVTASFAFGGTELVGLAAAECANPRKTIPTATKQVFWRISLFYVVSLFILGLIVPADNENLSKASGGNTRYSPFVLSFQLAGIKVLPSIFNAVITLSVISVANSCTFASTRTVQALCARGMGPAIGARVDSKGRPWVVLIVALAFGALAYVNVAPQGDEIFTWLLSLSGLSNFFTWGSICFAHIQFRKAWAMNGRTTDELPFQAMFGTIGSWIGLALNILCLIAQFYVSLFPIGGKPDAKAFFENYLAAPIVILFFVGYKVYYKQWTIGVNLDDIQIDEGRRELDFEALKQELIEERAAIAAMPWWKRQMEFWF
ncbi:amino acid permease/ SLC12A domain-containing protein [Amylocarpus encephaloides]|uniref:Amino acid permease/ SLC12A domain-containing protein n=1 Tax=Amylocarpus encephaloides TaxID=45428 RepID=A0A9P7YAB7_9HELO|nr:amino acid permease/ SLC12A domain-containing protein [Amylocarpus encephaloides]